MDNPDLIVACIVGDGEAETGPTATAWHSYKFIDPVESGAVLPVLHLNGYKIANPTIYGTMLNYLETSTLWRQEHNGFSHQSPGLINDILNGKAQVSRVYLPPDANCLISTVDHCLRSNDYVNLIIANKPPMPQWLSMKDAIAHCRAGASIWRWASTEEGVDPDVVLVGIGDTLTLEVMAAAYILRNEMPELRVRVFIITNMSCWRSVASFKKME